MSTAERRRRRPAARLGGGEPADARAGSIDRARLILDTHALVWLATNDRRISDNARDLVLDSRTELVLSVVSIWELAIKSSLGKVRLELPLASFIDAQIEALDVAVLEVKKAHALIVERLPFHHRDPFDRLLVAQAMHEDLAILSADDVFDHYATRRVWS